MGKSHRVLGSTVQGNTIAGSSQPHCLQHFALGEVGREKTGALAPHQNHLASLWRAAGAQASAPGDLSGCRATTGSKQLPQTMEHTKPTRRSLLHGITFSTANKGEMQREGWRVVGALRDCWNSQWSQGLAGATVYGTLHLSPEGEPGIHPGALAYLQDNCSKFPDTFLEPILAWTKGAGSITRTLLCTPGLPTPSCSSWVGQRPQSLKHLLSSCWPARTTRCTQSVQSLLLIMSLFQDRKRQLFCLIHINKYRK